MADDEALEAPLVNNGSLLSNGNEDSMPDDEAPTPSTTTPQNWTEFCENYSKSVAYDFAQSWFNYLADTPGCVVTESQVSERFVQTFVSCFENEARRICRSSRLLINNNSFNGSIEAVNGHLRASMPPLDLRGSDGSESDTSDLHSVTDRPTILNRRKKPSGFLRRFPSLKEVKNSLFSTGTKQQAGDEIAITGRSSYSVRSETSVERGRPKLKKLKKSKTIATTTTKTVVEVVKDGVVKYVGGRDVDGKSWEKCRMVLIKTVGGFMLEFYAPPKSSKPKSGIFCFLITEARETTALETPDHPNTFVLKAENFMEYVIEAKDEDERRSWLNAIRSCIGVLPFPETDDSGGVERSFGSRNRLYSATENVRIRHDSNTLPSRLLTSQYLANRHSAVLPHQTMSIGPTVMHQSTSNLGRSLSTGRQPRSFATNGLMAVSSRSLHGINSVANSQPMGETFRMLRVSSPHVNDIPTQDNDATELLYEYPWFHGSLSRSDASQLVLQSGREGHGLFLVRHSETRRGEYVLTFNCYGRAKHLRLTIARDGQCRVQRLWFAGIFEMLEYFRSHPIPLENGTNAAIPQPNGVLLTDYVIAWPPLASTARRPRSMPIDPRDFMTHSGSVRIRTSSLEQLAWQQARQNPVLWNVRAENNYQFT